jgi:hypothetical protein
MKFRWMHMVLAAVLLAPLALCVGCECKQDADCGQQMVPNFVGNKLVNNVVQLKCRDKHCEP